MEKEELAGLGTLLSTKIASALEAGDTERALGLCAGLSKEFVLVHKGLRQVLELLLPFVEETFRHGQARLATDIEEAVRAGEAARALELLEIKRRQHLVVHDLFLHFWTQLMGWALEFFGDEKLYEMHRSLAEALRPAFERWESMAVEDFVRASAFLLKSHMGQLTVEEDEEKFTLRQDPCGSGGRMLRQGAYDPPRSYKRIPKAQPMTFQRKNFPIYCSHCAVWNNITAIEWFGHPQWVHQPPQGPQDPCIIYIYKNPKDIPEAHYRLLGQHKRPSGGR